MALSKLDNAHLWQTTINSLHQAAMLFGPIHNALRPPRNNYLHLPMQVHPWGLSSDLLPQGGELILNFIEATFTYRRASGQHETAILNQHTQVSLFNMVLEMLLADELAQFFERVEAPSLVEGLMTKLHTDASRVEFLKLEDVSHTEPLHIDPETARDYAAALDVAFTGIARFRGRLAGHMTPMVVWPEHFDLSTLWFVEGDMDDHKAHMNFGFAPFSAGIRRPYLYAYAYPYPQDIEAPAFSSPIQWHISGWTGAVIHYDDLAAQDNPIDFIERMCLEIFARFRPLLG